MMGTVQAYRREATGEDLCLDLNESPRDFPPELKREVLDRLSRRSWCRYPDQEMRSCRRLIGTWYDLDETWVLLGNGSNELLGAAMQTFAPPGGRVFWVSPGFSMIPRQAAWLGRKLVIEKLREPDFVFPGLSGSTALHGTQMALLASPNNPTGTVLPRPVFTDLMACYAAPVVIDEAYGEFADESYASMVTVYSNLVVLRTFSKALSLAGGRIGYALARPDLIGRLEAGKLPFSVGLMQQACIEAMAGARTWIDEGVRKICAERQRVTALLSETRGVRLTQSQANFVLFSPGPGLGKSLDRFLRDRGIRLRSFEDSSLGDWLRVTIGTEAENTLFLKAVRDFAAREAVND